MKRVVGIEFDGSTVKVTIGRTEIPCLAASYGDNLQPEKLREMGSQQIDAITNGTYETDEAKIKMASSVFRGVFMPLVDSSGFGNRSLPVVCSFEHPDLGGDSDYLDGCRFTKLGAAMEASAKANEVEFGLTVRQIYWTDQRKTINAFDPSIPLGAPGL
jgi:hypothetical protein